MEPGAVTGEPPSSLLSPRPGCRGKMSADRVLSGSVFLILCRKGPVEAKPECQETETKPAPAEVKTVPNDATQTKENESKA